MASAAEIFLRTSGIAAAAIFGGAALAACTSAVSEQKAGGDDATPVRGGTLKVGIREDLVPANLLTNTAATPVVIGLVYESLIRYPNDTLEPQPLLAKSWAARRRRPFADPGPARRRQVPQRAPLHLQGRGVLASAPTPTPNGQRSCGARRPPSPVSTPSRRTRIVLQLAHPLSNIFDLLDTVPILDSETIDKLGTGDAYHRHRPLRVCAARRRTRS